MSYRQIKPYDLDKKLSLKQRNWIDEYIKTDDLGTATLKAGYNTTNPRQVGYENSLRLSKFIKVRREELNKQIKTKTIAELEEIQSFWTDSFKDEDNKMQDRLKASELLAKSKGGFIEKHEIKTVNTDWFIDEDTNDSG